MKVFAEKHRELSQAIVSLIGSPVPVMLTQCSTSGSKALETRKENHMLYTIALVLGVMWLLGMVTGYTAGYFIHILLVIAVVMLLLNLIQGRRT
jgi:hypothetical protein